MGDWILAVKCFECLMKVEKRYISHGADVTQDEMIWTKEGEDATLSCSHTKGGSYAQMYFYRQFSGETMRLVVYTSYYGKEDLDFGNFSKEKYSAERLKVESGTFTVKSVTAGDKAVYFCAVSEHSGSKSCKTSTKT
uniref:Ig-like domain-containing protein n=1 Tax=Neogobius melanostomus TaxID=47308 RepID=A0A8C6SVD8_9GOBI